MVSGDNYKSPKLKKNSFTKMLRKSTYMFFISYVDENFSDDVLSHDAREGRGCVGRRCVPSPPLSWIGVRYYT